MSDSPSCRFIFCRCCALATLDDTLHQSSVVGYMCKTIQIWCCHNKLRHLPMVKHSEESNTTVMSGMSS